MATQRFVFADNTFTGIFKENTGNRVDFKLLKKEFDKEGETECNFFIQKNETVPWATYNYLVKTFEGCGWNVHKCVKSQSLTKLSYSPWMESATLIAYATSVAAATEYHKEPVEFVLCVNNLCYTPFVELIKKRYDWIELTLVCDTDTVSRELLHLFDTVRCMYSLDMALAKEAEM